MPSKDIEVKRATARRHYRRHRQEVIAKIKERKWTLYAGTCLNCGGKTMGDTKGKAAKYCSRSECASVQRRGRKLRPSSTWNRKKPLWRQFLERQYEYRWGNNPRRAELKGRVCVIEARGARESVLARFLDTGERVVLSRRGLVPASAEQQMKLV